VRDSVHTLRGVTTGKRTDVGYVGETVERSPGTGRRLALDVHDRLRTMILTGELPPGSFILQTEMARRLGVSRTPMREAFRLLQEEGLIEAQPDQRAKVRAVDPEDLDAVYGARVLLETLAVSLTIRVATDEDIDQLQQALELMHEHSGTDEDTGHIDRWHLAHREFHRVATHAAGAHLQRLITSLGEHSERYIRLAQLGTDASWVRGEKDHQALLDAFRARDHDGAKRVIARHLARTALTVMADIAPECEPSTTRTALQISGQG
jgi:DNA-binding GntR family transcriptional regulator